MKYFKIEELTCKGSGCCNGGADLISPKLLGVLDAAREDAGSPIHVTSGYRCPTHNAECGGASQSYHMRGMAADVHSDNMDVYSLKAIIKAAMIRQGIEGGLQEYPEQGFVHVDVRGYWAEWC